MLRDRNAVRDTGYGRLLYQDVPYQDIPGADDNSLAGPLIWAASQPCKMRT